MEQVTLTLTREEALRGVRGVGPRKSAACTLGCRDGRRFVVEEASRPAR